MKSLNKPKIGGAKNNLTFNIDNRTAIFNSTGSLQLPAGTAIVRPDSISSGAIRYNTTDSVLEYYSGLSWYTIKNTSVVQINKQSFTGDGSTILFGTLNYTVTYANNILVFIGQVYQEPGTNYTITGAGTTITFTSPPPSATPIVILYYFN
jgi:hypothetical protein